MSSMRDIDKGYEMRMRIISAAVELGKSVDFADMTVSAICEEANISRQTFYRYFLDKYDAINWYGRQLHRDFAQRLGVDMTGSEVGRDMLRRAYDERDFYAFALRSDEDYNSLRKFVSRDLYNSWSETFRKTLGRELPPKLDFQLHAFAKLGPELIAEWVLDGCSIPIDEFNEYLTSCIPADLHDLMERRTRSDLR